MVSLSQAQIPINDPRVKHFAPHVVKAGLVFWGVGQFTFLVGTRPDEKGHHVETAIDPNWAFGEEEFSFEIIASRIARML